MHCVEIGQIDPKPRHRSSERCPGPETRNLSRCELFLQPNTLFYLHTIVTAGIATLETVRGDRIRNHLSLVEETHCRTLAR
jgi:hypothetical protein